jgi:signal transduction histidine kinase
MADWFSEGRKRSFCALPGAGAQSIEKDSIALAAQDILAAVISEPVETKSKILVVDDTAENRLLAKETLEDEGYEVVLASGGVEGLRLFSEQRPDCVLLDVRMPDMDGFEVCARLRELPFGDAPVVFLTALRDVDTFDRALRAGGDDFLTKPVRPTELLVRVQAALKLRRMSADLRENYELVRHQRDALMRLQLQKERLSSFVVHDLKNPVSAMDLQAQVLLSDAELPQRARDAAQQIRSDARSLMRLILNLLDISKSEEGKLSPHFARVDLGQLAREALESVELKAKAAGVQLARAVEVNALEADRDLLRRVLENLLDNAVRHTPDGGEVKLSASAQGDAVLIQVEDSGRGVPPELREKIFEPFVQVESGPGASTRAGRGLGLAFCRLAVDAHGGKIWVADTTKGTRVCISWPQRR